MGEEKTRHPFTITIEMAKVAKWIPARVAQGVYNNIDYIKRSADAMAKLLFLISNKV